MNNISAFHAIIRVCRELRELNASVSLENGISLSVEKDFKPSEDLANSVAELQFFNEIVIYCETEKDIYDNAESFSNSKSEIIFNLTIDWRHARYQSEELYIFDEVNNAINSFRKKAVENNFKLPRNLFVFEIVKSWSVDRFNEIDSQEQDDKLIKLNHIFSWFEVLNIAANVKPKGAAESNEFIYVHKVDSEAVARPCHLDIELPENLAGIGEIPPLDESLRKSFIEETSSPHIKEKTSFLRLTIVSLLSEFNRTPTSNSPHDKIIFICNNLKKLAEDYHTNYEAFLENLSASKLLKDLEESELEYTEKINLAISQAQSKAFAVPAVFVAMALLARVGGIAAMALLACSALFTGLIIHFTVTSQKEHLHRIRKSIFRYFAKVKYEDEDDQEKFSKRIRNSKRELLLEVAKKQRSFDMILKVGWAPMIVAIVYILFAIFTGDSSAPESPQVIILPIQNI